MEDFKIVDLYWARDEAAIRESDNKYGKMLHSISYSLLSSWEDAEECVNDTYLDAWGAMPVARPAYLGAFLSKITRRISVDRWRSLHREKRGGIASVTEELTDCIPDGSSPQDEYENARLTQALNRFLVMQPIEKRAIFIRRYFCSQSIDEIAAALSISEAKVKTTLHRMREALRKILEEQELL
ncbi:MAG: RNA polymerase sigma factor [Clostridia bacterium]|nr:RNA polymerase sigma factor [Clostridia bacterium]